MLANVKNTSFSAKFINACLIAVFLVLVSVTVIIRIRMLSVSLERDEGEYAYSAQLMLHGIPPYKLAYNMKMPGIYAAYAVILAIFGQTATGIHFGVLLINTATVILIYFLAKKLFNSIAGVAAAIFFAITSISNTINATANAENFVVLPAIAAILLLIKFTEVKKNLYLISGGLLMGIAFMMKQHAIGFIIFSYCVLFWNLYLQKPFNYKKNICLISIYSVFVILPFLFTCLVLWQCGVFDKFWFWTFDYAHRYVSIMPFATGIEELKRTLSLIVSASPLIWLLSLFGLLSILWNKNTRKHSVFLILFFICSFIAVCPGWYFRNHYFLLLLPATVILAGAGIVGVRDLFDMAIKRHHIALVAAIMIFVAIWMHSFYVQKEYLLEKDPVKLSRMCFGLNGFTDMQKIAEFIKNRSGKDDKIAVLGSEPEIFFYSQRCSATSYIYMFPLMEPHPYAAAMQREAIQQIESCKPKYLVFVVRNFLSWLNRPKPGILIFDWLEQYQKYYRQIGLVEILKDKTLYYQDDIAVPSDKGVNVFILERIN